MMMEWLGWLTSCNTTSAFGPRRSAIQSTIAPRLSFRSIEWRTKCRPYNFLSEGREYVPRDLGLSSQNISPQQNRDFFSLGGRGYLLGVFIGDQKMVLHGKHTGDLACAHF